MHDKILILDFGSQVTQLIGRRVREAHVYCEIHPNDVSDDFIKSFAPKGIILAGSHPSPYADHQLPPPRASSVRPRCARMATPSCWTASRTSPHPKATAC